MKVRIIYRSAQESLIKGKVGAVDTDYPNLLTILDDEDKLVALVSVSDIVSLEVIK